MRKKKRDTQHRNYFKIILSIIVVVILGFVAKWAYEKFKGSIGPSRPPVQKVQPTKPSQPENVYVFIDNSTSMEGYAHGNEYLDALADLMSIYPEKTTARGINDTTKVYTGHDLVTLLTPNKKNPKIKTMKYVGQSMLNEDLAKIVKQVSQKNALAFFVTDGIMSGSDADINSTDDRLYNIRHKEDLMHDISKAFKNSKCAVSVYRLASDFEGVYYCFDNKHSKISARRPFYVIAIGGNAGCVVDFKEKLSNRQQQPIFKFRETHAVHFIDNKTLNQGMSVKDGTEQIVSMQIDACDCVYYDLKKIQSANSSAKKGDANSGSEIKLILSETTFKNYAQSIDEINDHLLVKIDGSEYKAMKNVDKFGHSINITIKTDRLKTTSEGSEVAIIVPYFTPAWIDNPLISIEGDKNNNDSYMIRQNQADMATFLFHYFINGIKNNGVIKDENINIYEKTLTLIKK